MSKNNKHNKKVKKFQKDRSRAESQLVEPINNSMYDINKYLSGRVKINNEVRDKVCLITEDVSCIKQYVSKIANIRKAENEYHADTNPNIVNESVHIRHITAANLYRSYNTKLGYAEEVLKNDDISTKGKIKEIKHVVKPVMRNLMKSLRFHGKM